MPANDDDSLPIEELRRYIDDVRMIKRTLNETEGSFRIFAWFYYVMAALVLAGMAVNLVLNRTVHITMHESFIFVWIPVFFLSGGVEILAWILKSTRENVPLLTPAFTRYLIAFSGVLIGLFAVAFLLIRPEFPVAGIVLILVGMMFCIPLQYTHFWFVLEALGLVALGLLFILMNVHGTPYLIADGIMVAGVLILAGLIESILSRRDHHG